MEKLWKARLRNENGATEKKKPTLMLTSLLDMFTIILIFLIVSFEAEDQEFKLDPGLKLPESTARSRIKPAANVAITMKGIKVQEEQVIALSNGIPSADDFDEEKGYFPKLVEILERVLSARQNSVSLDGDEMIVMLQADRGLTYRTLYMVMRSAGEAGLRQISVDGDEEMSGLMRIILCLLIGLAGGPAFAEAPGSTSTSQTTQRGKKGKKGKTKTEKPAKKDEAAGTMETGGSLRRSNRMEFDGRLVKGEKADGAVYLFQRVSRPLPPLLRLKRQEIDKIVWPVLRRNADAEAVLPAKPAVAQPKAAKTPKKDAVKKEGKA